MTITKRLNVLTFVCFSGCTLTLYLCGASWWVSGLVMLWMLAGMSCAYVEGMRQ